MIWLLSLVSKYPGRLPCVFRGSLERVCEGTHALQGKFCPWALPALQAPCLAPCRRRFPRWAQRTTIGLTNFTSGCQHVAGLSDSKQICMQEPEPMWQKLFWPARRAKHHRLSAKLAPAPPPLKLDSWTRFKAKWEKFGVHRGGALALAASSLVCLCRNTLTCSDV